MQNGFRGELFPIARIAERLKCPRCGTFPMGAMFNPPSIPKRNAAAARNPRDALYVRIPVMADRHSI